VVERERRLALSLAQRQALLALRQPARETLIYQRKQL